MFTLLILFIYRIGNRIPVPYVDVEALRTFFDQTLSNTVLGFYNTLSGSAFSEATILALSIQPYINASIIIQLLTVAIPPLERLQRDGGEAGKRKLEAITRYSTLALGLLQGFGYYMLIRTNGFLSDTSVWAAIVIIATFTAGSVFVMWLGEQITGMGIGNGISILLFAGIISRLPSAVFYMYEGAKNWAAGKESGGTDVVLHPAMIPVFLIGMILMLVFIVYISLSERKIPVQYAKRVVGRKMYGGQSTHLPIKVNMSGVLPIIFAQSIASLPATIIAFTGTSSTGFWAWMNKYVFDNKSVVYMVCYFLLIIAFSYFYATIQFNPIEIANNLKKNGGFIPGFRPGKPTADFILKVINKITLFGALYLAIVAIMPILVGIIIGNSSLGIGGTSVIIVVGVALETVKAMEAQMLMRHYKGFLE